MEASDKDEELDKIWRGIWRLATCSSDRSSSDAEQLHLLTILILVNKNLSNSKRVRRN